MFDRVCTSLKCPGGWRSGSKGEGICVKLILNQGKAEQQGELPDLEDCQLTRQTTQEQLTVYTPILPTLC